MTQKLELSGLPDRIREYGRGAFLVTVGDSGTPHVVSVAVDWDGATLSTQAGRTSRSNIAARPSVTLLWPGGPDDEYGLLVDGTASAMDGADGPLTITPTSGILHRLAAAEGDGPTCLPVTPGA
jgi:Pyridoxamine 5'-phosphate oxidase